MIVSSLYINFLWRVNFLIDAKLPRVVEFANSDHSILTFLVYPEKLKTYLKRLYFGKKPQNKTKTKHYFTQITMKCFHCGILLRKMSQCTRHVYALIIIFHIHWSAKSLDQLHKHNCIMHLYFHKKLKLFYSSIL